MLIILSFQ